MTLAADPVWHALAASGGRLDGRLVDRLQAAWARMMSAAAHAGTDGYLTEGRALALCHGRRGTLDRLATAVLDRPPLLHSAGDRCACLDARWVDGYAYRLHDFRTVT